jgi:hypothetical protein
MADTGVPSPRSSCWIVGQLFLLQGGDELFDRKTGDVPRRGYPQKGRGLQGRG